MIREELIEQFSNEIPILLSQTRISFLIGAGCSKCAGLPLMPELTKQICLKLDPETEQVEDSKRSYTLLREISKKYLETNNSSIEDFLSEIQDIDSILLRQQSKGIIDPIYNSGENLYERKHTQEILRKVKETIVEIIGREVSTVDIHRKFCRAIHFELKKGRDRTKNPVNYFILNYDTLIEDCLAIEKVAFNDGFVGGATAWWDPSRFGGEEFKLGGDRDLDARVYKLHGSIDWIRMEGTDFPMRIRNTLPISDILGNGEPAVIYPASIKYKETQHDPYSQMIMSFRKHMKQTDNHILAIMGYGFNDEHINVEIKDGLRHSEGALSLLIFLGTIDLPNSIKSWLEDSSISSQILVLGKFGIWKDGMRLLTTEEQIDWYKFEKITELLSGVI